MEELQAIPLEDVVTVLRLAAADWPADRPDFSVEAVASAAFNGYLDHEAKLTDAGRTFLTKVGPIFPEGS